MLTNRTTAKFDTITNVQRLKVAIEVDLTVRSVFESSPAASPIAHFSTCLTGDFFLPAWRSLRRGCWLGAPKTFSNFEGIPLYPAMTARIA